MARRIRFSALFNVDTARRFQTPIDRARHGEPRFGDQTEALSSIAETQGAQPGA